jgi:hypothetical protein
MSEIDAPAGTELRRDFYFHEVIKPEEWKGQKEQDKRKIAKNPFQHLFTLLTTCQSIAVPPSSFA